MSDEVWHTRQIAPSMLKCDFGNLLEEVRKLERAGAQVLHWDVMDGHFVPNLSYGAMVIQALRNQTSLFFDAHLMISEPERYLQDFLRAGCQAITIHIEAVPNPQTLLEQIRSSGAKAGLALNPPTPVSAVIPYLSACDLVLVMSVMPGFGGQSFMPEVLPKLQELRALLAPEVILSVDGGVGPATIQKCAQAGAQWFVTGSAIFEQVDYGNAIQHLRHLVETATRA